MFKKEKEADAASIIPRMVSLVHAVGLGAALPAAGAGFPPRTAIALHASTSGKPQDVSEKDFSGLWQVLVCLFVCLF